jgi:2-C-methyl-D-erythritol 4-phosphate cytidylyltransferase
MSKNIAVIICAAGSGTRFGGKRKKPFVDVAGRAVFLRSVELFSNRSDVKQILLAIPEDDQELVQVKWGANLTFFNVKTYIGGSERFETVQKGLDLVKDDIDFVAVHDACRCCVTEEIIDSCIEAAISSGAAIPACPVTATIKKVNEEDEMIFGTLDRTALYEAQTPQIFATKMIKKAYENLKNLDDMPISDDAQLVEAMGLKVSIVKTDSSNIKITTPGDIAIAEAILKSRAKKPEGPGGAFFEAQW